MVRRLSFAFVLVFAFFAVRGAAPSFAAMGSVPEASIRVFFDEGAGLEEAVSPYALALPEWEKDILLSADRLCAAFDKSSGKFELIVLDEKASAFDVYLSDKSRIRLAFWPDLLEKIKANEAAGVSVQVVQQPWSRTICLKNPFNGCKYCLQVLQHNPPNGPIEAHFDISCPDGTRKRYWCPDLSRPGDCRRLW